ADHGSTPTEFIPNSALSAFRGNRPRACQPPKGTTRIMLKNLPLTKILLTLAAVAVVAVAAVGGTFANFTATPTSIASNAFAAGTLTMNRSGSGAIFSSAAMKIGDTADRKSVV